MGHIFTRKNSEAYAAWRKLASKNDPLNLGKEIFCELLDPKPGESFLDIGCGIGEILEYAFSLHLDTTGIDPSRPMLDYAAKRMDNHSTLYACYAEDLPFADNSFNFACLFLSLEFVRDPEKALEEAFRVAKDKVFIGLINPYALKGFSPRIQKILGRGIFSRANLFSLSEIKRITESLLGNVPISWRSTGFLPEWIPGSHFLNHWSFAKKIPFGAFMGISITLVPRFRLEPLALSATEENPYKKELTGLTAESAKNDMQPHPEMDGQE